MVALAMRGGCGFVGVRGFIVELGGSVVRALRHCDFLLSGLDAEIALPAHPPAINGNNRTCHVVARGATEVQSSSRKVLRLAPARRRNAFKDLSIARLVGL